MEPSTPPPQAAAAAARDGADTELCGALERAAAAAERAGRRHRELAQRCRAAGARLAEAVARRDEEAKQGKLTARAAGGDAAAASEPAPRTETSNGDDAAEGRGDRSGGGDGADDAPGAPAAQDGPDRGSVEASDADGAAGGGDAAAEAPGAAAEPAPEPAPDAAQGAGDDGAEGGAGAGPDAAAQLDEARNAAIATLCWACAPTEHGASPWRVREACVAAFSALIARGELAGDVSRATSAGAQAIEAVCASYDAGEEQCELPVMRCLLTAVTSTTLHVHGDWLLRSVRTCYHIYLNSKSEVNQQTAKASLSQMLNMVFARMEADSGTLPLTSVDAAALELGPSEAAPSVADSVSAFLGDVAASFEGLTLRRPSISADTELADGEAEAAFPSAAEVATPAPQKPRRFSFRPSSPPAPAAAGDEDADRGDAVLNLGRRDEQPQAADEVGEGNGGASDAVGGSTEAPRARLEAMPLLARDAYLVFRALCKLSMKALPDKPDAASIRGKTLSLALLKLLLENAGPTFCTSDRFVGAIRQYLCLSLLKNCSSPVLGVFQLTCSIFLTLCARFRDRLKAEVGVFFPMIMLRVLDGQTGAAPPSFALRSVVLNGAGVLARDPQMLVDLFVNYDCDREGSNLFERFVAALIRLVQGSGPGGAQAGLTAQQEAMLKASAATALRDVLSELCNWVDAGGRASGDDAVPAGAEGGTEDSDSEESHAQRPDSALEAETDTGAAGGESGEGASAQGGGDVGRNGHVEGPASPPDATSAQSSIEQQKRDKLEFQEGVTLFNKKPKKGIAFMIERGKIGSSPAEIAAFLKSGVAAGLDKTMIGDYLGENAEDSLKVMHAYVDALDFTGMVFDDAIRHFLLDFRLPGEAQKIDRLMEKFAERFCLQTPGRFRSADTAYVLAYSVIMLNTDAHNPQVKNKMTKEGFLKNNRGVGEEGELTPEFLGEIYDRITTNEIKLKDANPGDAQATADADNAKGANVSALSSFNDMLMGLVGTRRHTVGGAGLDENAIRNIQERLEDAQSNSENEFVSCHDPSVARPMLEAVWPPLLAALSLGFEGASDGSASGAASYDPQLLLQCTRAAVRMAAVLGMETVRDAFITALAKFTYLHEPSHMNVHNVNAIRTMLAIVEQDGDYLGSTWAQVLKCVSRLAHLLMVADGAMTDASLFGTAKGGAVPPGKSGARFGGLRSGARSAMRDGELSSIEDAAGAARLRGVLAGLEADSLDRVFVGSARLDGDAVVDFVDALCKVSLEELRNTSRPRIFSLQKVVEISYFNIGTRIRLVWSRIWGVLAEYFVSVGCHENLQVAMYAIDSLRQLSMKFLEKDEMAMFSFQDNFLKPFVIIMRRSRSPEIRELIIRCLSQMIQARVDNVSSGWKSMFMVFTTAATDENRAIVKLAFETIERIVRESFGYITETEATTFTDCVNCLIAFTNSPLTTEVSLNAIAFLRFCALKLAEGLPGAHEAAGGGDVGGADGGSGAAASAEAGGQQQEQEAQRQQQQQQQQQEELAESHSHFWFPLLAGLGELVQDERPDVRRGAREVLFDTLRFHGHMFTPAFWERVFSSVVFPIFDEERGGGGERALDCLPLLVDLFVRFYDVCAELLLPRVLELLVDFVSGRQRASTACTKLGVGGFVTLAEGAGDKLGDEEWRSVVRALTNAWLASSDAGHDASSASGVLLVGAAGTLHDLARTADAREVLREALAAAVERGAATGDLGLEMEANATLLRALVDEPDALVPLCAGVMDGYLAAVPGSPGDGAMLDGAARMQLMARSPLVSSALSTLAGLPAADFKRVALPAVFARACGLVRSEHADADVRAALAAFFSKVGEELVFEAIGVPAAE